MLPLALILYSGVISYDTHLLLQHAGMVLLISSIALWAVQRMVPSERSERVAVYLADVPYIIRVYQFVFAASSMVYFIAVVRTILVSYPGTSLIQLYVAVVALLIEARLLFSVLAMATHGLWAVFDLRRRGFVATKEATIACVTYLGASVVFGPGATLVGLWWWRERKMLGISSV